jgi:hypothetical protein
MVSRRERCLADLQVRELATGAPVVLTFAVERAFRFYELCVDGNHLQAGKAGAGGLAAQRIRPA